MLGRLLRRSTPAAALRARRPLGRLCRLERLEPRLALSAAVSGTITPRVVNGTPTENYPAVGIVGDSERDFGTGTLITNQHVLTSAHTVADLEDSEGRFTVGGVTYGTSQIIVHPNYDPGQLGSDGGNDVAILVLAQPVAGATPMPMSRQTPEAGSTVTLVGYGAGGDSSGHDGSFGTKRSATTTVDGVSEKLITVQFDNAEEGNTAPGDSGAPAVVQENGQDRIAGVASAGTREDSGLGDTSYFTRADAYAQWVEEQIFRSGYETSPDEYADVPGEDAAPLQVQPSLIAQGAGALQVNGDRDVFRFDSPVRGAAAVYLTSLSPSLVAQVRAYNSAGKLIAQAAASGSSASPVLTFGVGMVQYYLSLGAAKDKGTGYYGFSVIFTPDDYGDRIEGARRLSLNSQGEGQVVGNIGHAKDRDVFQVVAPFSGTMEVTLRSAVANGLDPVLAMYDANGKRMTSNNDKLGKDSQITPKVEAGQVYYFEASSAKGTVGDYALSFRMLKITSPSAKTATPRSLSAEAVDAAMTEAGKRDKAWRPARSRF